jgi:hypothetical protein
MQIEEKKNFYLTIKHFSTQFFHRNDIFFFLISCFIPTSVTFYRCHLDPQITDITFNNFPGSIIIIITSIIDDEHTKEFMLSSPRTNGAANLFNSNHHLTLITQPILAARSRKKNPITNNQRISFNDSPSIILPVNRVKLS